jgi:hypothetical protein
LPENFAGRESVASFQFPVASFQLPVQHGQILTAPANRLAASVRYVRACARLWLTPGYKSEYQRVPSVVAISNV